MFDIAQMIRELAIVAIPLLMGITFHEVAHGYVAYRFGDPTAKNAGRLTLNPLKHLDPMGTLVLVLTRMIGWAKPVPINPSYFEDPRKGIFWVSLAGPLANFGLAVFFYILFNLVLALQPVFSTGPAAAVLEPAMLICFYGIIVNIILGIFNLFPIPPLDGSKILATFLPGPVAGKFMQLEKYGFIILILLIFLGVFGHIFGYVLNFVYKFVL
ncbi:site-2 protease family protein [Desulfonatronovibrio hydrogenovorans]|uniref:site-2 protease family protein n=1 Tax=Desulfonatronovibrio hydrogenovorans TaxID=53245 RepID=UPI00048D1BAB|nr:site-2 protease family protein [Desulfonatronovibrio hydrogenovorans]